MRRLSVLLAWRTTWKIRYVGYARDVYLAEIHVIYHSLLSVLINCIDKRGFNKGVRTVPFEKLALTELSRKLNL